MNTTSMMEKYPVAVMEGTANMPSRSSLITGSQFGPYEDERDFAYPICCFRSAVVRSQIMT